MMSHKFLCVLALFAACAFALEKCGDNLFYELVGDVLTINGTGAMNDYSSFVLPPWSEDNFTTVDIKEGATTIGKYAFYNHTDLTTVYIPDTVEVIEKSAFSECVALHDVNLPIYLKKLGSSAFYHTNITSIIIPETLETLEYASFSKSSLKFATYLGNRTFEGVGLDFCTLCNDFKGVCLNPDYNVTRFAECCNETIAEGCYKPINGYQCQTFLKLYTRCNKAVYKAGGMIDQVKREETAEWEGKSNKCYTYTCSEKDGFVAGMSNLAQGWIAKGKEDHCMEYVCINETGNAKWSSCNTTATASRLCIDTCTTNWEPTFNGKWWLDIVLDNNTSYLKESLDLRMTIANLGNVKHGEISVYYKMDEYGNCMSIIVRVKDEKSGNLIKAGVESIKKEGTCRYELLCHWKEVILNGPKKESSSAGSGSVSIHGLSGIMTFFMLVIGMFMN